MLVKAHRTRDLASYSLGNLLLANVGNAVHSVYVFSLPAGPIWAAQLLPCDQRFDADLVAAVRVAPPQVYARHPQGWFARSSTTATTSTYRGTGSRDTLSQGDRLAVATNRGMPVGAPGCHAHWIPTGAAVGFRRCCKTGILSPARARSQNPVVVPVPQATLVTTPRAQKDPRRRQGIGLRLAHRGATGGRRPAPGLVETTALTGAVRFMLRRQSTTSLAASGSCARVVGDSSTSCMPVTMAPTGPNSSTRGSRIQIRRRSGSV
jgi:hypothetical protein